MPNNSGRVRREARARDRAARRPAARPGGAAGSRLSWLNCASVGPAHWLPRSSPDLRRPATGIRRCVSPRRIRVRPSPRSAGTSADPREEIGDDAGQHISTATRQRQRQEADPLLEQIGRQVRHEHDVADLLASIDDGKRGMPCPGWRSGRRTSAARPGRGCILRRRARTCFARRNWMSEEVSSIWTKASSVFCGLSDVCSALLSARRPPGSSAAPARFHRQAGPRENLQRYAAQHQRCEEARAERKKQLRSEGRVVATLGQF